MVTRFYKERTVEASQWNAFIPLGRCPRSEKGQAPPSQSLLPPDVVQIGVAEVFLGEDIIGVQPSGDPKLLDGMVPVAVQRIGVAQIVMRSCFVGRLTDRIGPKQEPVFVKPVPLIRGKTEHEDQRDGQSSRSKPYEGRPLEDRRQPLGDAPTQRDDRERKSDRRQI